MTFPTSNPIDFASGKPAKVTNSNQINIRVLGWLELEN